MLASVRDRLVRLELRRRFVVPLPGRGGEGWAHATLDDAMRRPVLLGVAVIHAVMALVALGDDQARVSGLPLAAVHLFVAALALSSRQGVLPPVVAVLAGDLAYLLDWASTDSLATPLIFAACWARNTSVAVPTFAMAPRTGLAMQCTSSLAIPVAMVLLRPDLPASFAGAVAVTGLSITTVTRVGVSFLGDLAGTVDRDGAVANARRRDLARQQAASMAADEDARVLHDTVINTMVAIAAGGAATRDIEAVRRRCAEDVETLELLRAGRGATDRARGLRELPPVTGLRVEHHGLTDSELTEVSDRLAPDRLEAVRRSCAELVQNAARHSGADEVRIGIEHVGDELLVEVADRGRGFDLEAARGAARGLERSVLDRCRSAGVLVDVDTAPGKGTRVRMVAPITASATPVDDASWQQETSMMLAGVARRAGLLYTAGLAVVAFVLAFSNHQGEPNTEYVMAALNVAAVAAVLLGWRRSRSWGRRAVVGLLLVVPPISFVMTALAVDLGRDLPVLWQAIGPTGPMVLLLGLARSSGAVRAGVALYLVATASTAAWVWPDSVEAAVVVLLAGGVGLGLLAGWSSFMSTLETLGRAAAGARREAERDLLELERRAAAERTRQRWRAAGLGDAMELVRRIASGELDPRNPGVRAACTAEESYLRQLTLMDARLVSLGGWLVQSLARARARKVDLSVRTGGDDVPDGVARDWGQLLRRIVDGSPEGAAIVASVFPDVHGTRLMVLAPKASLEQVGETDRLASLAHMQVGDRTLVEMVVPAQRHTDGLDPAGSGVSAGGRSGI